MSPKSYYAITGFIFLIVAIIHLLRVLNGWTARIDTFSVPMWASWVALVIAGYLASQGLRKK